jgi:CBS domain-containing protein
MTGDIYLGRLFGIPFRLHWSWFLAVFLISWTLAVGFFPRTLPEYSSEGRVYWTLGLLAALGLFVSILLHERRQPVTVEASLSLREVADQFFLRYPYKAYPVVRDSEFLGILTLRALQEVPQDQWDVLRAGEVVARSRPLPVVQPEEPVLQALRKLAESGHSRLAVVENGVLVGLLCGRDVMNLMEIRAGLALPRTAGSFDEGVTVESKT